MNKIATLALLMGGVALITIGINASNPFCSDIFRFMTGPPIGNAVWMLISGIVAATAGLTMALRGRKQARVTGYAMPTKPLGNIRLISVSSAARNESPSHLRIRLETAPCI
jgi:hypothetical protein